MALKLKPFLKKYIVYILFFVMLTIALISFKSYGISWDENAQRDIGTTSLNYVLGHSDRLLTFFNRDYGVAFELPLVIAEKALKLQDTRAIYEMRHLATHILFLISAVFLFKLIDNIYKNKKLAVAGFLMLVLNPLLYAHSFFNSKDIPFLSVFIICLYLNHKALSNKKYFNFVLLGIASGLLINIRIMGIILPFFSVVFLAINAIKSKQWHFNLIALGVLALSCLSALYVTWPFLWINPIGNFMYALHNMSKFRWDGFVLFGGKAMRASQIPWYYAPVWFFITSPLTYIAAGLAGIALLIWNTAKKPIKALHDPIIYANLMFAACFAAPILSVILLHSVLYDSWRQLFFIYPSFVMLAIFGLSQIKRQLTKQIVTGIFAVTFAGLGIFMIANHPFQQAYFNETLSLRGSEYIRHNYEMDYWCVAAKQSLEHILKNESSSVINIAFDGCSSYDTVMILKPTDRARIAVTAKDQADYLITSYRGHPQSYTELNGVSVYKTVVSGSTINEVFKLKN